PSPSRPGGRRARRAEPGRWTSRRCRLPTPGPAMTDAPGQDQAKPTRLILYVGKGGVGKTTAAATTAVRAAALGHPTLVVSTDIAHSLGDVLDVPLGASPELIAPRLWAQEINVLEEVRRRWGGLQAQMAEFLRGAGASDLQADELAIVPG